jgi:hypothetical protein
MLAVLRTSTLHTYEPHSSPTVAKQWPNSPADFDLPLQCAHMKLFEAEVHRKGSEICKTRIGFARIITDVVWTEINRNL